MTEDKNLIGKEILTYRIESLIGKGGMGSVYLATNKYIDQKVAIKVLNANLAGSPVIRQKFVNEAKTLLALDHPNIVHFLNFVENEDGVFLIMEYIDGITLDDFIYTKNGLIVENRIYSMFTQILDAFAYAHKQGVIHRDIKPANIILTNDNDGNFVIKILDFGIARIISESNEDEKGMIVGTPAYMSPEQVCGEEVDKRSDIYSLGVLLHQMLTGHAPYDSTTLSEIEMQKKVVEDPLPRMKEYFPYVSDRMQKVVDKATAKKTTDRFPDCAAFRKDFLPKPPVPLWKKITAASIIILLLAGGWWFYDYSYVTKIHYYKDYVEKWGVPAGIGKLSTSEFENKVSSYRFEKLKGKIIRVSHVNNKRNIVEHSESEYIGRFIDILLYYTESGKINYIKYLDRNGKVLYIKDYDESLKTISFKHDDEGKTGMTLSANTTNLFGSAFNPMDESGKSKISKYILTYDDNGYLAELRYAGFQALQVCDNEGVYGKRFTVDKKGRVTKESYLGKDFAPKANKAGLAIKTLEYDDMDNLIKVSYFSADESPGFDGNGCHIFAVEYDKYSNRIKETYYDKEGDVTLRTDSKVAGFNHIIENGRLIRQTVFGVDGEKCYISMDTRNPDNDNFGYYSVAYEYDENGYVKQIAFLDTEEKPITVSTGISIIRFENDLKGNFLREEYFDMENKPCENIYGYAKIIAGYNPAGNLTSVFYRDSQDSLCLTMSGIAGSRNEYDEKNRHTKQVFLGTDGEPCEDINGIITTKYDYDLNGNLIKMTHLSADEKELKQNTNRVAGCKFEYTDGYTTQIEYFNEKEAITSIASMGFAKKTFVYNEYGDLKEEAFFDENGKPVAVNDQIRVIAYSKIEYEYNENGYVTEEILYNGNVKKQIIRYKYDEYDHCVEISLFDGNNSPILKYEGWHKIEYSYNNQQQVTEQRYYNTKGRLTLIQDEVGKYAISRNEYDRMGRISRQTYLGEDEQPTPLSVHTPEGLTGYDRQGNMNYVAMADGHGNIIYSVKAGYAYKEMKHDIRGNITEERFYSADKKLRQNNFAIARYKYDEAGRLVEYLMHNHLDKTAEYDEWHRYTIDYDEQGIAVYQKYYSLKNNLIGTYKYNKQTQEWDFIADWRQYWRNTMSVCPMEIDYGVELSSIALINNGCNLTIRFTGVSKYTMDDSEKNACKEYANFLKEEKRNSQMPAGTQLNVIGVDKEKRELFRVTY